MTKLMLHTLLAAARVRAGAGSSSLDACLSSQLCLFLCFSFWFPHTQAWRRSAGVDTVGVSLSHRQAFETWGGEERRVLPPE